MVLVSRVSTFHGAMGSLETPPGDSLWPAIGYLDLDKVIEIPGRKRNSKAAYYLKKFTGLKQKQTNNKKKTPGIASAFFFLRCFC